MSKQNNCTDMMASVIKYHCHVNADKRQSCDIDCICSLSG